MQMAQLNFNQLIHRNGESARKAIPVIAKNISASLL